MGRETKIDWCDATVGEKCHECTLWRPETESCPLYGDDDGVDYADIECRKRAREYGKKRRK